MACLGHDDAGDRAAPPVRGDRARPGWCFWRGWGYRRTCASSARGFCEHPSWSAHALHSKCSSRLKRKLVSVTIGTSASVREPVNPAFLVAIEDFVAGFARNPEIPAQFRHGFTREPPSHKLQSLIHNRTLLPRHCTSSPELVVSLEK